MLKADDVLEPVMSDLCDSFACPLRAAAGVFSSWPGATSLVGGGLLPNGFLNGGMIVLGSG